MKNFIRSLASALTAAMLSVSVYATPMLSTLSPTLTGPAILDSGHELFTVSDRDGVDDDITSFILNRNASNSNTVGIYDPLNIGNSLELWNATDDPGFASGTVLNFDGVSGYTLEGTALSLNLTSVIDAVFGMYIESNGQRWYSQAALNAGGRDHLLTFLTEGLGGDTTGFDIVFAWEDLDLGDEDYNDVVYGCIDCEPFERNEVPSPGPLALLGAGLIAMRKVHTSRQRRS